MMNGPAFPRLALSIAIGLAVSVLAGLQAVSMLATRSAPEAAIALFPANGEAYEWAAFNAFTEAASDAEQLQPAAASVRSAALETLRRAPTSAKAHALLALAEEDVSARHEDALAASRINRRDLTLQGLVLEARLANGAYGPVVETLDQILRVHPTYRREFYPALGEALRDDRTIPVFKRLLDGSSQWHEFFFRNYAIGQPDLLVNLAKLRAERDLVDRDFDRRLIAGLVKAGELDAAGELFVALAGEDRAQDLAGQLEWRADFPPFDWQFTDESDFRAQASRDGEMLELYARPGQGGVIAQRILPVPPAPFALQLTQAAENASQADAVRIELLCPGQQQPFFTQELVAGANSLTVENAPDCEQMQLAINARAYSGQPTLRSELGRIEIVSR